MKKSYFMAFAVLAAGFCACKKENVPTSAPSQDQWVKISLGADGGSTRGNIDGNKDFIWHQDDVLGVFSATGNTANKPFTLTDGHGDLSALFEGVVHIDDNVASTVFHAVYPCAKASGTFTACNLSYDTDQVNGDITAANAVEKNIFMMAGPSALTAPDALITLHFSHLVCLWDFNISGIGSGDKVVSVTARAKSPAVKPFWSQATIDLTSSSGCDSSVPVNAISVNTDAVDQSSNSLVARLSVLPVAFPSAIDLEIVVETEQATYVIDRPNKQSTFEAGKVNFTNIDLSAIDPSAAPTSAGTIKNSATGVDATLSTKYYGGADFKLDNSLFSYNSGTNTFSTTISAENANEGIGSATEYGIYYAAREKDISPSVKSIAVKAVGSGLSAGDFSVALSGLTSGIKYARTYIVAGGTMVLGPVQMISVPVYGGKPYKFDAVNLATDGRPEPGYITDATASDLFYYELPPLTVVGIPSSSGVNELPVGAKIFMLDRNIGAKSICDDDQLPGAMSYTASIVAGNIVQRALAAGYYFQWGQRHPTICPDIAYATNENPIGMPTSKTLGTALPTAISATGDWNTFVGINASPCPEGYHIPSIFNPTTVATARGEWVDMKYSFGQIENWANWNARFLFGSTGQYTALNNALQNAGIGYYHGSNTRGDANQYVLRFEFAAAGTSSIGNSNAAAKLNAIPVRCIRVELPD